MEGTCEIIFRGQPKSDGTLHSYFLINESPPPSSRNFPLYCLYRNGAGRVLLSFPIYSCHPHTCYFFDVFARVEFPGAPWETILRTCTESAMEAPRPHNPSLL